MCEDKFLKSLIPSIHTPSQNRKSNQKKVNQETHHFENSIKTLIPSTLKSMKLDASKNFLAENYEILLEAHLDTINVLKLTSDSKYIISGSADRTIRIWDFKKQSYTVT